MIDWQIATAWGLVLAVAIVFGALLVLAGVGVYLLVT